MVRGEDKPADNAERLSFAQIAYDQKKFAFATRLWAEALDTDPKLGDDRQAGHRYKAARAAALAAASGDGASTWATLAFRVSVLVPQPTTVKEISAANSAV